MGVNLTHMLCNDCEQLPKCECCGKPMKDIVQNVSNNQSEVPLIVNTPAPVANTPLIPIVSPDDEVIGADKPRKPLNIRPDGSMEGILNRAFTETDGWGLMK